MNFLIKHLFSSRFCRIFFVAHSDTTILIVTLRHYCTLKIMLSHITITYFRVQNELVNMNLSDMITPLHNTSPAGDEQETDACQGNCPTSAKYPFIIGFSPRNIFNNNGRMSCLCQELIG